MQIFLSSTCYDLKDLRAEVESFLIAKGHNLLLSDRTTFPHPAHTHRHDICIANVSLCDLFILVIDSRFGAPYYKDPEISITWAEFREALKLEKQIIAFVRQDVFNERMICKHNLKKGNKYDPFYVDNLKIFEIISEIQQHKSGIWIQLFDTSLHIKEKLNSMHDTNFSPLNTDISSLEIPLNNTKFSDFSDATRLFLNQYFDINYQNDISKKLLQKVLDKLSEYSEKIEQNDINKFSDNFFYSSFSENMEEAELSLTAIGKSVKKEIESVLEKVKEEEQAKMLFIDTVKKKPIWCILYKFESSSYIISFYEEEKYDSFGRIQHLCVLKLYANKWQIYYDSDLEGIPAYIELFNHRIIIQNKKHFLYFERVIHHMGTMNNGFGDIEFIVFDFEQNNLSKLKYSGVQRKNAIDGHFDFESSIIQSDTHKFILEQEASKSSNIYRTPEDYDIDAKENCIRKWEVENPNCYGKELGSFNFFYYNECILFGIDDYPNMEEYKKHVNHTENVEYILFYYFAGPVIALEKSTQRYFVVFVPEGCGLGGTWGLRSINSATFINNNRIFIKNEYESYEIDLITGEYKYNYFGC